MSVPGTGTALEPILMRAGETTRIEARPLDQRGQPYTGEITGGNFSVDFSSINRGVSLVTDPDGMRATVTAIAPLLGGGYAYVAGAGWADDLRWSGVDSWGFGTDIENFLVVVLDANQFLFDQASPWIFTMPTAAELGGVCRSLTATPVDIRLGGSYKVKSIAWTTERQTIELAAKPTGPYSDTLVQGRYWPGKGPARPTRFGPPPDYLTVWLRPKATADQAGDVGSENITITATNSTGVSISSSIAVAVLKSTANDANRIVQI